MGFLWGFEYVQNTFLKDFPRISKIDHDPAGYRYALGIDMHSVDLSSVETETEVLK